LAAHLAGNAEFRDRFLREARIAARLHHPHLVRTFDITELDGLPCIVMELLPGGTLAGGRLTREHAAQVADALAYAHGRGVVHRDVKPANLLRGPAGEVKIGDFGIARAAEETMLTQAGTVLGTLRYLSPEQAEGRRVGPEADVYSLGIVLQELLEDPDPALVERCLARNPRERPTAGEVAAALASAPTVVKSGARHRTVPGKRFALYGGVGAALVAAGAAVILATHRGSEPVRVPPVPHAATPAQQARNLEAWLTRYST
ncbi:MAG: serine/threonine-protein kinase, partial [Gaiellaceae bacterium]